MIYIRESYNSRGIYLEKTIFYHNAIDEFTFDYNYHKNDKDSDIKITDNGFEVYMRGRLWLRAYLAEKE